MKKLLSLFTFLATFSLFAQLDTISGTVLFEDKPLADAKVENLSRQIITMTDAEGNFSMAAKFKDKVKISYTGKREFIFTLIQTAQPFTVHMSDSEFTLDEVVVAENRKIALAKEKQRRLQYFSAFGNRNFPSVNSANVITKDKIWPADIDILSVLRRVPRVRVSNVNTVNPLVTIPSALNFLARPGGPTATINNPNGVLWDIDGMITREVPLWLNVLEIEKMVILDRRHQTTLYGNEASSGVIVINTRQIVEAQRMALERRKKEQRRFKERAVSFGALNSGEPGYITKLNANKGNADEAFATYLDQAMHWGHHPHFHIDVYEHFNANYGRGRLSEDILDRVQTTFTDNMQAMKLLAFKLEEANALDKAREVYRIIAKNRPNNIQAWRDLANIEAKLGNKILADRLYLATISKIILSESPQLTDMLDFMRSEMNYHSSKFIPNDYEASDIEIIVEWDNPTAEFELQFINGEGFFDSWKHTIEANPDRINHESIYGVGLQRFYIDSIEDLWNVNIKYFGNESLTKPTFMKVTIRDTRRKKEKIKVFRLNAKDVSQNFAKIAGQRIVMN